MGVNGSQVKSKQRVADHGEVFTAEREVNAMLDLVGEASWNIETTFLEPACGNGNFLNVILLRKLKTFKDRYGKYSNKNVRLVKMSLAPLTRIYGVEILADNAVECRDRLFNTWRDFIENEMNLSPGDVEAGLARDILATNIVQGNFLTLKQVDGDQNDLDEPIYVCDWTVNGAGDLEKLPPEILEIPEDMKKQAVKKTESKKSSPKDKQPSLFGDEEEPIAAPAPVETAPKDEENAQAVEPPVDASNVPVEAVVTEPAASTVETSATAEPPAAEPVDAPAPEQAPTPPDEIAEQVETQDAHVEPAPASEENLPQESASSALSCELSTDNPTPEHEPETNASVETTEQTQTPEPSENPAPSEERATNSETPLPQENAPADSVAQIVAPEEALPSVETPPEKPKPKKKRSSKAKAKSAPIVETVQPEEKSEPSQPEPAEEPVESSPVKESTDVAVKVETPNAPVSTIASGYSALLETFSHIDADKLAELIARPCDPVVQNTTQWSMHVNDCIHNVPHTPSELEETLLKNVALLTKTTYSACKRLEKFDKPKFIKLAAKVSALCDDCVGSIPSLTFLSAKERTELIDECRRLNNVIEILSEQVRTI